MRQPAKNFSVLSAILLITFLSFLPALKADFTHWDDNTHLTENSGVRELSLKNLKTIFTSSVNRTYIPLTVLTWAIEYRAVGDDPFLYHLNNLLMHVLNTGLVFALSYYLMKSTAAAGIAALVFGIHPMHVESVLWITERKDVLYSFFYLSALICYWRYLQAGGWRWYALVVTCGLFSLLAKPMALSLPLMLFLFDWMAGRRFSWKLAAEKLPLILYTAPITWLTYTQHARIPPAGMEAGLIWVWCFSFYLQKFLWPGDLSPLYMLPKPVSLLNGPYLLALAILGLTLFILWRFRKYRWVGMAFGFYFLSVFFLLRFEEGHDLSIVADRFMYLSSLGFCGLAGIAAVRVWEKLSGKGLRGAVLTLAVLLVTVGAWRTYQQARVWQDGISLWSHVIARYPDHPDAYNNRGGEYNLKGEHTLALQDFNRAIELNRAYLNAYNNRALVYKELGKYPEALNDFSRALRLNTRFPQAYNNRALVHQALGEHEKALADFDQALTLNPGYANAYYYRGRLLETLGRPEEAVTDFSKAYDLDGRLVDSLERRARLHEKTGNLEQAVLDYSRLLTVDPHDPDWVNNRANNHVRLKRYDEALAGYNLAISLHPAVAETYVNRGSVYWLLNQPEKALADYSRAIKLEPGLAAAYLNRSRLFKTLKRDAESLADLQEFERRKQQHIYNK